MAGACPFPKVDREDQPCFGCGKTGHQSKDCPEKKKRREREHRAPLKAIVNGAAPAVCPTAVRILCFDMPPIPAPDAEADEELGLSS